MYGNLGNANYLLGDYSKALEYHTQHLAIAKEVADRAVEGEAYGRLGTGYLYLNDVDKTVVYFEAKKTRNSRGGRDLFPIQLLLRCNFGSSNQHWLF